jgi:hypothetical protein
MDLLLAERVAVHHRGAIGVVVQVEKGDDVRELGRRSSRRRRARGRADEARPDRHLVILRNRESCSRGPCWSNRLFPAGSSFSPSSSHAAIPPSSLRTSKLSWHLAGTLRLPLALDEEDVLRTPAVVLATLTTIVPLVVDRPALAVLDDDGRETSMSFSSCGTARARRTERAKRRM